MVKIRLKRMGTTKRPVYRLVVADSRSPRDGRFIESIGFYDPLPNPAVVSIDADRVQLWLRRGARPSDSARQLLVKEGILGARPFKIAARVEPAEPAKPPAAAGDCCGRGTRGKPLQRNGRSRGRSPRSPPPRSPPPRSPVAEPSPLTAQSPQRSDRLRRPDQIHRRANRFNPSAVAVEARPRGRSTIVTLQVAEEDMGKLIGKTGRNIEAVRAVVTALGLPVHHQRVQVELKDLR